MSEPTVQAPAEVPDPGVFSRFLGVLLSPRQTFEAIVRRPRWLGMMLLVIIVTAACTGWFQSTAVGRQATVDESVRWMESFGMTVSQARYAELQRAILDAPTWRLVLQSSAGILVFTPLFTAIIAGLLFAGFAMAGGDARFKTVFTVTTFSGAVGIVQQLFVTPLNYIRESVTSSTNLAVFFPMLDEGSFLARLLGMVDLFRVWSVMLLAIGLAVAYRRRTRPIAIVLFVVYALIAIAIAGVMAMLAARSAS